MRFPGVEYPSIRILVTSIITRSKPCGSIAPMLPATLEQSERLIGNRVLLVFDAGKTKN